MGAIIVPKDIYIAKILEQFRMRDCKPMHSLMVKEHYLRGDMCLEKQSEVQRMKEVSYSKVIKSLAYCVAC